MDSTNRRQSPRIDVCKTLKILSGEKKEDLWETLVSINRSDNGIQFESRKKYAKGDHYILRYTDIRGKLHDAPIEIMWIKEIVSNAQYHIGARFITEDKAFVF